MASSIFASLSKKLLPRRLPNPNPVFSSLRFFTAPEPEPEPKSRPASTPYRRSPDFTHPLQNGLDPGVFKAILVGKAGQTPVRKQLRLGKSVVLFAVGTGGIRNNRRILKNEDPREYEERCAVQWHRVSVYGERLGDLALKHVKAGSILYLEGSLETKVFNDPVSGLVRRIREIAIRADGRLIFLNDPIDSEQSLSVSELKGVGYY